MFKNKSEFKKEYKRRLIETYGCLPEETHITEKYMTLGTMVRDYANVNWKDTKQATIKQKQKQVYYFSMEFLLGKLLTNNLKNLGIEKMVRDGLKEMGISYDELAKLESDPGLGNGGLGRLAACFMDSAATNNYPVNGNCIRYRSGLFRQFINKDGEQVEVPDMWLRIGNPWEIRKPKHSVDVKFYGELESNCDENGDLTFNLKHATHVLAVPYDMALIGANTKMTNTLRLWSAEPADMAPRGQDYRKYLSEVDDICMNVYPDDSTEEGKYLRLKQQYFFVCAGIDNILDSYKKNYGSLKGIDKKIAIQLNDTHPVLAIPELMRILMDDYHYAWEEAFETTVNIMAYTNHTVMSEALEKWPVHYIQTLLPRIYMIIEEIDRRFKNEVYEKYHDEDLVNRISIIRDDKVHMASLAIVGSHSVNGVARLHSDILKKDIFRDYYNIYPKRFSNKTNGITPRRWMIYANPELEKLLDKTIGKAYHKDSSKIEKLLKYADDDKTIKAFLKVKKARKKILQAYIKEIMNIDVDDSAIFDVQAKRLHAYKRQLLNIMHVIYLYQELKKDPQAYRREKRVFIFAAKAASSYSFAKKVIKLINNVAKVINNDPEVKDKIKVIFLPNYNVSMSEVLVPATDISEQISTAGKEASGTGNMKFMMNGAITLGTLDGANVEIDELVGRENDIIFGHTVEELNELSNHYNSREYYENDERIRKVVDSLVDGTFSSDPEDYRIIYDDLVNNNDMYYVLADFDAYVKAQEEAEKLYKNKKLWANKCLINIAKSGYFSSDRTIEDYANDIWKVNKLEI